MRWQDVEVGKEYLADLWGEKAKVKVLRTENERHNTLASKTVIRHRYLVQKEDGQRTIVAASKLSKIR